METSFFRFDSDILEGQYWRSTFPRTTRRYFYKNDKINPLAEMMGLHYIKIHAIHAIRCREENITNIEHSTFSDSAQNLLFLRE